MNPDHETACETHGIPDAHLIEIAEALTGAGLAVLPLPDGMTVDDATRALNDARPWVAVRDTLCVPTGARIRHEWTKGDETNSVILVHRDDVPTDPDAHLIERIASAIRRRYAAAEGLEDLARAALAVIREDQS